MSNWTPLSPSRRFHLAMGEAWGMTDIGLSRSSNEDNFLIDPELGLVMLGDGMGGHDDGEIASETALLSVRECIRQASAARPAAPDGAVPLAASYDPDATWSDETMPAVMTLFTAIESANAELYARNRAGRHAEGSGMGTTLTGFWQFQPGGPLVVCHIGDSRLYRYRDGALEQLTRDQTLYQEALEAGLLDKLPSRNLLLQAVGPSESLRPDVRAHVLQTGDRYLLCSDGLHGSVPHTLLADLLRDGHAGNLEQTCVALIEAAKEHGSRDNITVVLLACPPV